nr:hypothetical protein [Tanacetum cinerariifolium]
RDYHAYEHYVALCEQKAGGSSSGLNRRRTYIPRERETAEQRLMDDYFGDEEFEPKYPKEIEEAPECAFMVNEHTYRKCYYLADGIYPAWSTFVKSFSVARDEKCLQFKRVQEAARKDIERAFEVLQVSDAVLHFVNVTTLFENDTTTPSTLRTGKGIRRIMMTMSVENSMEAKYMPEDASSKKFLVSNFTNYKMTYSRPVMKQYNKLLGILERTVVRLPYPKIKTLGERGIDCIFIGYAEHSKAFRLYVIEPNDLVSINSIIESRDVIFDENKFSSVPRPSLKIPNETKDISGSMVLKEVTEKARLVIKSFKQKSGIDYFNTYALVARISTIRLLIAMASIHNLIIHQMDVMKAFLNGNLDEEAPKQRYQKFDEVVLSNVIYLTKLTNVYIANLINLVDLTKEFLLSKFPMKDTGEADVIHGIKIKHGSNGITISQSYYIEKYSRVIGCLMYAMTCTRPDIAFAVGKLSRYTSNPETQHCLEGYTDASWISNTEDNSSTSGWVFPLGGGTIFCASKKQTCITGSTMEYEFMALAATEAGNWRLCKDRYNYFSFDHFDSAIYWNDALDWLNAENRKLTHYRLDIKDHEHPIITTIQIPQRGMNFLQDDIGSSEFTIYKMMKGCSVSSVSYSVDNDDFMTPLSKGLSIRSTVWCIVLGEREDDSLLVINLSGKVVQYNLISKTLHDIFDCESNQLDDNHGDDDDELLQQLKVELNVMSSFRLLQECD